MVSGGESGEESGVSRVGVGGSASAVLIFGRVRGEDGGGGCRFGWERCCGWDGCEAPKVGEKLDGTCCNVAGGCDAGRGGAGRYRKRRNGDMCSNVVWFVDTRYRWYAKKDPMVNVNIAPINTRNNECKGVVCGSIENGSEMSCTITESDTPVMYAASSVVEPMKCKKEG